MFFFYNDGVKTMAIMFNTWYNRNFQAIINCIGFSLILKRLSILGRLFSYNKEFKNV